jgi:small GTP-binding protein
MSFTKAQGGKSISKKIFLLGATGVGKTHLFIRYVHGIFDEEYMTTIGAKVEGRDVSVEGGTVRLLIWDLEGWEDPRQEYLESYIKGADGYLLVVDGTRPETLNVAKHIQEAAVKLLQESTQTPDQEAQAKRSDEVPFVAVLNKRDLVEAWRLCPDITGELSQAGWTVYETSAKTGENVIEAFQTLVRRMLQIDRDKSERGGATLRLEGEAGVTVKEEL